MPDYTWYFIIYNRHFCHERSALYLDLKLGKNVFIYLVPIVAKLIAYLEGNSYSIKQLASNTKKQFINGKINAVTKIAFRYTFFAILKVLHF